MSMNPSSSIRLRIAATAVADSSRFRCIRSVREVEPAVAEPQRLVDALVVELEGERRRARHDLELVHLELDLAGRHLRVHGLGRAGDHLALRAEHELVADLLRDLRRGGRALGVHDELHDARPVAEIDEHEAAVVAAPRRPARHRQRLADVRGPRLAAHEVAPLAHRESLPTISVCATVSSA